VYSAFVSPDQVSAAQRDRVANGLVAVLGADRAKVMATLESGSKFAYISRRLPKDKADKLRALKLPGVGLENETQRSYLPGTGTNTTLAANLLGFVKYDGEGQYGLEAKYQTELAGTPGYISSFRDLANREIVLGSHIHQSPVNGSDLVLSLDANIQYASEQALAEGVQRNHAESGSVLIMDPTTGGIVAWADYPSYNANDFVHTDTMKQPTVEALPADIEQLNQTVQSRGLIRDPFFSYDEATLSSDAQSALTSSASWLKTNPTYNLLVEGHCDERGTEQYNLALGDRRASIVRDYLVTLGVDTARIRTVSYGEERPFDPGHNEAAWAKNRRAHLVLVGTGMNR